MNTQSRLSKIFNAMKARCYNQKNKQYKDYGGRGIHLCNEWNNREKSYKVNALIPKNLARICHAHGIKLIHVSTNEVFSNSFSNKCSNDTPNPTSVYGMHKYLGELFIKENMDEGEYAILRTSWLYGMHNSKSFIHKCVKTFVNHERNGTELFGIDQEISIPTDVSYLSELILNVMKKY